MTPEDMKQITKDEIERRVRDGMRTVLEEILEEEMTAHLQARRRERTASRQGERNGHYERDLITGVGKLEQLQVPRRREGEFLTEVFDRYKRMTGSVEEAVLEMYLQGVSTRKVADITQSLSGVSIGKDAVSRIAQRLEEELSDWRTHPLLLEYPYLYLDATYLKANWGGRVVDISVLVVIGVNEEGYRQVLAIEPAGGERKEAYRNLLKGLLERGLRGVRLVISDDHESIKAAVQAELPGVAWQRCIVHFQRNILAHVPQHEMGEVAGDLKAIFQVQRETTAHSLAEGFVERYGKRFPKAIGVFQAGLGNALTYLRFPNTHYRLIRTTNGLERLFKEVKRRTRVIGVFPGEKSVASLVTAVVLRVTEEWNFRKYLDMEPLKAMNSNPQN